MSAQPKYHLTATEYLVYERNASEKHEFYRGEVFVLAGASEAHNIITLNVATNLNNQLQDRPCRVYANDMRVKVPQTGLYTYPDVIVVCGERSFEDEHLDTLLNPTVIVEVLSPSTENYDRGKKFQNYRTLASLFEYLLVAQETPHIEHYTRRPDNQWLFSEANDLTARIHLASIECDLVLEDVYRKVEFSSDTD